MKGERLSALRPLFEEFLRGKEKFTVEFPFQPSRRWQQFFIKIRQPHLCFHCLRVTYVNRLRRAGVPREAAMRLVNHSSELVHQNSIRNSLARMLAVMLAILGRRHRTRTDDRLPPNSMVFRAKRN